MTVQTTTFKVVASGNGVATSFSFSPMVLPDSSSQIQVTKVDSGGAETLLVEENTATGYAVVVSAFPGTGSITYPASGGTPLASGESLAMKRILTLEQQTDLENQGGWFPETQELQFDRFVMIDLQQQETLDRSFSFPVTYTGGASAGIPTPIGGRVLGWNSGATALENKVVNSSAYITLPGSSTDNGVIRWDGTSGNTTQDSGVTIDDSNNLTVPGTFAVTGAVTFTTDLPIASGGTGSSTAAAARTALAVPGTATENTFTARQNWAKGGDIASASPLVIDTDGNYFDVTGTTGFSAMTVPAGTLFMLQFDGALVMTHGSSLKLPGAANITTVANDRAICFATAANVVDVISYTRADGTSVAGATQNGQAVQAVNVTKTALDTSTTSIALDDTIPQNTEGKETMTLAITPKSTTNKLRIDVVLQLSSGTARHCIAALFQDSTTAALGTGFSFVDTAGGATVIAFTYWMTAGTTTATTFKVRFGNDDGSSLYLNGIGGARRFGGTSSSSITITEIQA